MDSLRQVDTEPLIPLEMTISKTFIYIKKKMHDKQCRKAKEARECGRGSFLKWAKKMQGGNQVKGRQTGSQHRPLKPA